MQGKSSLYHCVQISRTKRTVPNSKRTVQLLPAIFGHCPLGYDARATNVVTSTIEQLNDDFATNGLINLQTKDCITVPRPTIRSKYRISIHIYDKNI